MPKMPGIVTAIFQKHIRVIVAMAIILMITLVVFRNWIFSAQWPAGGDILGWISREYLWKDNRWLFVWRPSSFGYPEGVDLKDFLCTLLQLVTKNAQNTVKIFGISSFAFAGFSMYALGYHFGRRNLPALAGSLVYTLNGQFLTELTEAHLDIMFSYAVAPMIFLFLDRALENGRTRDVVACSILFGVMLTGFHVQMKIIYGAFLGLFVIMNLLRRKDSLRFRDGVRFRLKTLITICIVAIVLSACFWMPLLFGVKAPYFSSGYSRGVLEDAYAFGYKSFGEAFTLASKGSNGYINILDVATDAGLLILPVQTILLLVFAFAYAITLVFKLNRYSFFFGLSALISIILSMGPHLFEPSFLWAWSHVPYFQGLRAISRWDMVAAFSNSFFVCMSTGILTEYLQNILRKPEKSEVGVNFCRGSQESRNLGVSMISFSSILHSARRLLWYSAILALVAMLMSGFISTWFLFSRGLQVYTPPSDYVQPYEYLGNISGEYKIVTVGRSTSDWYSVSGQDMDFVGGMITPIGWNHDLGYESTFIHDKPTLQDGGLSSLSTDFVNYLRFCLARNNITRNLLKLLGAFNYEYVVIPSYATGNERDFFMSQYGGTLIYNQSNNIILKNEFYTPEIYAPKQSALVLGGQESLSMLCDIDSFDLGKTAVILANQADNFPAIVDNHLNDTSAIVFADADPSDLITMSLLSMSPNDVHLIYLADYGMLSRNTSAYWIKNDGWTNNGAPVLGGRVLTTSGNNEMNIPIELNTEGDYDMLIRAGFTVSRGKLLVSIDGLPLAEVIPYSDFPSGLQWINLTSNFHLEAGSHLITLLNDGTGYNDLDAIAIVEHSKLAHQAEETINALQSFTGKILYVIEAEKAFSKTLPEGWYTLAIPGEGYALHMESGGNVAPQASASASSVSIGLEAQYAIDGNPSTRWASSPGLPQWLETTFPTLQELYGVRIDFEAAYGEDYRIQTWNGTDWIDQVVIENNSLLQRVHMFPQPVTTQKLRILVTSAQRFNMVSIWELETFSSHDAPSSKIFVPRKGEYNFAARLFPDKESTGTLYLKVDEKLFSISCPANESKTTWFEPGSALLDVGEHNVSIFASGSVALDKIGIYSASNNEHSIDDVFKPDLSTPSVSCEEVNPCKYAAHINCTKPFLLVFSESYHPLWKAYVDNKEISPIIVNSLANGFYINRTGSFDVVLYFTGQEVADVGLVVSGGSIVFVIAVVLVRSAPAKKVRRFMMNRRLLRRP